MHKCASLGHGRACSTPKQRSFHRSHTKEHMKRLCFEGINLSRGGHLACFAALTPKQIFLGDCQSNTKQNSHHHICHVPHVLRSSCILVCVISTLCNLLAAKVVKRVVLNSFFQAPFSKESPQHCRSRRQAVQAQQLNSSTIHAVGPDKWVHTEPSAEHWAQVKTSIKTQWKLLLAGNPFAILGPPQRELFLRKTNFQEKFARACANRFCWDFARFFFKVGSESTGQTLAEGSRPAKDTIHSNGVTTLLHLPRWTAGALHLL